jgi:hypothetical protein
LTSASTLSTHGSPRCARYGLGGDGHTARGEQRGAARGVGMHAAADVLVRRHLEVRLHLLAEIVICFWSISTEEATDSR